MRIRRKLMPLMQRTYIQQTHRRRLHRCCASISPSVGGVQCGYRIHVRPPEKEKSEQLLLFIQPLNVQYIYLSWKTHTKGIRRIKVYRRRRLYLDNSKRKAAAVIDRRVCGVLSINSDLFHTPKGPETVYYRWSSNY